MLCNEVLHGLVQLQYNHANCCWGSVIQGGCWAGRGSLGDYLVAKSLGKDNKGMLAVGVSQLHNATKAKASSGKFTSRELLTSAMVAVMPFLEDLTRARAKDRILCLHLIVCKTHPLHVINMMIPQLRNIPIKADKSVAIQEAMLSSY